jgi:predicted small secreted protein
MAPQRCCVQQASADFHPKVRLPPQFQESEIDMRILQAVSPSGARTVLAILLLLSASALLSACNTAAGAGQDVSATGRAVATTADKVKQGL